MSVVALRRGLPLAAALLFGSVAHAQKPEVGGTFTDRAGQAHTWIITANHALMWDRQSYVPIGGTFAPRWLALGQTEENWGRDVKALELLKSRGMMDLLIDPVVSAIDVPPAAWQRLVDYLDAGGFRYGIGFGAGIRNPLSGTVIKPSAYRREDLRENVDVVWNAPECDSARYVFADARDGTQIVRDGQVRVDAGVAVIGGDARVGEGTVGILYPHKALKPARDGGLPDVWAGFDGYRDRLLGSFGQVKFGPGLRFFLDPLLHPITIQGEAEYIVPDSSAFRLEWEAYLVSRYPTLDDLMNAWGCAEREIKDFKQAARMIPLWADRRGVPFLVDPNSGARMETRWNDSRYWNDLRDFRNDSVSYYMNTAADLLKAEIANVPVVYTRSIHHRIFTNANRQGGFDGLGIAAYARGSALVTGGADSVFSQSEEAARPMWCLVTETMDTASPAKPQPGYGSRQSLFYDLDWLRRIGAKGFYVNGFQVLPEETYRNFQLAAFPEQIDWLHDYGERLRKEIDLASSRPRILPFPANAEGVVQAGPVGNSGVLLVPSLSPGKPLLYGSSYAGFTIAMGDGEATVLWSLRGVRETRLVARDPRKIEVSRPDGQTVTGKVDLKKHTFTVTMDENPMVIRSGEQDVFPMEAAGDAITQLQALIRQGKNAKLPVGDAEYQLSLAENNYKRTEPNTAYQMAAEALNNIVEIVQPYTWKEAELADSHTFSEVALNEAASGRAFLSLNTDARPGREGYGAIYRFNVPADDVYTLWLSATPPGPQASSYVWIVDTNQPRTGAEGKIAGSPYLTNQFAWINLGRLTLKKGAHTFALRVTDPAGSGRYFLSLDALLVTRVPFTPNGTARPALSEILPPDTSGDKADKKEPRAPARGKK